MKGEHAQKDMENSKENRVFQDQLYAQLSININGLKWGKITSF